MAKYYKIQDRKYNIIIYQLYERPNYSQSNCLRSEDIFQVAGVGHGGLVKGVLHDHHQRGARLGYLLISTGIESNTVQH